MAKRRIEKLKKLHSRADLPETYSPHFHDYIEDRIILRSRKRRLTTKDRVQFQEEIAAANRRGDITNAQAEHVLERLGYFSGDRGGPSSLSLGHRLAGTYTKYAKKRKRGVTKQKRINKKFADALFAHVK